MAKLSAAARKRIPTSSFAVPAKATTPAGKARSGSYPIPDASHARNALARSSGKAVAGKVRAAVKAKFPGIGRSTMASSKPFGGKKAAPFKSGTQHRAPGTAKGRPPVKGK